MQSVRECSRASSVETLKADSSQDLEELAQKSPEVLIEEAEVPSLESVTAAEAKTEGEAEETKTEEAKEESPKIGST